jgi:predicted GH43/DUF377 family glycosyl hydrolase
MKWAKRGLVWGPDGSHHWAHTHASCPTPLQRRDGSLRLYLQCRDARNVGRIGWVDVDPADPTRVLRHSHAPVLDVGAPGCFDDNGVFPTSVVRLDDGRLFLYYVGFELCHHIRYRLLTGVAVSDDDGESFHRLRVTPILERSPGELHIRGGAFVRREGARFRMWYVAGSSWELLEGKPMPVYDLRHLESQDGVSWAPEGRVVMPIDAAREHGFGRPYVTRDGDGYRLHYSIRRRRPVRYRLGFARSHDGLDWRRDDEQIGLDVSPGQWDGDSICYGAEVQSGGRTFLFYNGDDFGARGFGVAELIAP